MTYASTIKEILIKKILEIVLRSITGKFDSAPKSTPTTSSTGDEYLLQGTLCYAKSSSGISSSYYRTEWLTFDSQGRFTYDYESTFSSDADILYDEGDAESGTYKVVGDNIRMTFSDETSVVATVYFRQDDGRITEIYCGDRLYATSLC